MIVRDISLKELNTYRIGGVVKFFTEAKDIASLKEAVAFAQSEKIPFFIVGGGTNILVGDDGFEGLVIKMSLQKFSIEGDVLRAEAGAPMGALVQKAKAHSLSGLEWAAGLPGTLGGAIYGNAGSFGGEIQDIIVSVKTYDPHTGAEEVVTRDACAFSYRSSIFKSTEKMILSATLKLMAGDEQSIGAIMKRNLESRRSHQPLAGQSEGCVFKNAQIAHSPMAQKLVLEDGACAQFKEHDFLPAGFLIDKAGLKGLRIGGAQVSDVHANFIVNDGTASSRDIRALIMRVQEHVFKKFGIMLEEEIRFLERASVKSITM